MLITLSDQTGNTITLEKHAERIISIVPSQTELLSYLGLDDKIIAITKFCIHPKKLYQEKVKIGGTKKLHIEKIKALKPDLIIANKEENTKSEIFELQKYFPVYISDIISLEDTYTMISDIGKLTNTDQKATALISNIKSAFSLLKKTISQPYAKAAYVIWNEPIMVAGNGTIINTLLKEASFKNTFFNTTRYPTLSEENFAVAKPEIILLSSEPFPFQEKHIARFQKIVPNAKIFLVDGEMFSWYGNRLLLSPEYFIELKKRVRGI